MTTVRDAIESLRITDTDDGVVVLACYETGQEAQPQHRYLDEIGSREVDSFHTLYVASGLFRAGAIVNNRGRKNANVTRVNWLVLDCDLKDYLGIDDAAILWELDQRDLDDMVAGQAASIIDTLRTIGIPAHRVIYSGYGTTVHVCLHHGDRERDDIPALHKRLVAHVNAVVGYQACDPQASDGGARITRVPGSQNNKGAISRHVRILAEDRITPAIGVSSLTTLLSSQPSPASSLRRVVTTDRTMPDDMEADIISAVAPYWTLGHKHSLSLYLSAMLAKAGVEEAQAMRIITALSADDEKPWDRRKSVADTYNTVRAGHDARGYYGLRDCIPESTVTYIDTRLQQVRQATKPANVLTFGGKPVDQPKQKNADDVITSVDPTPIPDACYAGWLGEYVEMMLPLCEAPPQFHLASAMGLAGATFGRRLGVRYVSKTIYANQYFMLIGVAGDSKKDTAIELALELPDRRGSMGPAHRPFEILTDVGSAEGLIGQLSATPNLMLYITEYERLSQNAKRKSTSTIIPTLTTAWNAPNVMQTGTREETNLQAKLPTLSILAAVQPDILTEQMTPAEMSSGFASRWLYVPGKPNAILPDPPDIDEKAANRLYLNIAQQADAYGRVGDTGKTVLNLSASSKQRWHDWYHLDHERKSRLNEIEAAVASRLAVHIRKIALIYAGIEGATSIELNHLESAIAFVEWCWEHTFQLMQTWGTSFWGQIEERIKLVLKRGGPMPRRTLQIKCSNRKWGAREFAQVLDAMIRNGTVDIDVEGHHALAA